ncbi:OmpW/AlkL family protein [Acinetobacter radioresistens]|uniref:OmpW family protein n=1 Tax=Acinetobacter radioresistens SK82 TaxID=596318 RepID=A0ABM9YME9_ACIRA|nr:MULTISPECIES: OmpW family outer membrane protein [Acinetobacter]EET82152.1 OmpW family protein [Acinetobacter radioresistens SK82]EEY87443.1 OmpW family protein [Acinetobacter radioresistens SH164]MCK4096585.1 OmpW family protein [Acinetobacter radioresistens]MCK4100520.1 OmpW family protein [Acinetobacter radioresistens]MCK4106416.1 OmpW family protein [Acinetobacter radioresistens]
MKVSKSWINPVLMGILIASSQASHAEFKRFSVSAGWLHVMPQGKANPFNINTAVKPGTDYGVGSISQQSFLDAINPNAVMSDGVTPTQEFLGRTFEVVVPGVPSVAQILGLLEDNNPLSPNSAGSNLSANTTGTVQLEGIDQWRNDGTGLEAEDVDTLGLTFSYYVNDNVSLQVIGGIPPKVDIKGKGEIVANMTGQASPNEIIAGLFPGGKLDLQQDIPITNLGNKNKASSVRAWTPAIEVQYQFGKTGVNKFRPYIGAGIMYAYFNDIKLNPEIETDLINAGHMIQNIIDNRAGAALDGKLSSADPYVKVETTQAIAPIVTLGATYDLNSNWYGVASVSYAKLSNHADIDVFDSNTGRQLIHSRTKIDIDPLITYLGVGYRF